MDLLQACCSSPELWQEVLLGIQPAIIVTDLTGAIIFCSPAVSKVLGFDPENLIEQRLDTIFTPEDRTCLYPNVLYLCKNKKVHEGNVMLVRADGSRFIAFISARPYFNAKTQDAVIIFCIQDVNRQKELEAVNRQTPYTDLIKLANGIAHEIRNPLVGIGGFLNRLFKTQQVSPECRGYYDHIMHNLGKIENLVKKVEYFAHLPKPSFSSTSIGEIIANSLNPFCDELKRMEIAVVINCQDLDVLLDKELAMRAVSILIENALDALCERGSLEITAEKLSNELQVDVSDNGVGISVHDLVYIFNPFFSTKPDGAGIDLAIVKRIMEMHGGDVKVFSRQDEGTTFSLHFPLERRHPLRVSLLQNHC